MSLFFAGLLVGFFLRGLAYRYSEARCPRVRYGSQCRRLVNHRGPHKAWIDWTMSPTGMGHTEHWHDESELS